MTQGPGYEKQDINFRVILLWAVLLGAMSLGVFFASGIVLQFDSRSVRGRRAADLENGARLPPAPRLESAPRLSLDQLRAEENAVLDHYGWMDREARTVHIPIDEAMRRLLEQGLPTRRQSAEGAQ